MKERHVAARKNSKVSIQSWSGLQALIEQTACMPFSQAIQTALWSLKYVLVIPVLSSELQRLV